MKKLALDIGDVWTGSALSDALGIIARPHITILTHNINTFLIDLLGKEKIDVIVVGYPKTMRGSESAQTKKTYDHIEILKKSFPGVEWVLWDERLSSKRADSLKSARSSDEKKAAHSRAAAFILDSYLNYRASIKKNSGPDNDPEFE